MILFTSHARNILLVQVVVAVTLLALLSWRTDVAHTQLITEVDRSIAEARQDFLALAGDIDNNRTPEAVAEIVRDCTARESFDDLLGRLNALPPQDLTVASQLLDACGDFFARQREVSVLLLEQELAQLNTLVDLRNTVANNERYDEARAHWPHIVAKEKVRAQLLREQVVLQRTIVDALQRSAPRTIIDTALTRASEVTTQFGALGTELRTLRQEEGSAWDTISR